MRSEPNGVPAVIEVLDAEIARLSKTARQLDESGHGNDAALVEAQVRGVNFARHTILGDTPQPCPHLRHRYDPAGAGSWVCRECGEPA